MPRKNAFPNEMLGMIVASILIPAILLIGSLAYVAFYANGFNLFQKAVIVIIALVLVGAAEALLWMVWAAKSGQFQWPPKP